MDAAFAEVMSGQVAKRKKPTQFSSDFRMTFLPNGELDRQAMFEMHDSAILYLLTDKQLWDFMNLSLS